MYDVIMTNIEYSYKPGRFYIQYSSEWLLPVFLLCFFQISFALLFFAGATSSNVDSEANYGLPRSTLQNGPRKRAGDHGKWQRSS